MSSTSKEPRPGGRGEGGAHAIVNSSQIGPGDPDAALYREVVQATQDGVWVLGEDDRTIYVNARMAALLGKREPEILGRTPAELLGPDLPFLDPSSTRVESHSIETCLRRTANGEMWVSISRSPLTDETGSYRGAVATVRDITERRAADERLRESREQLAEAQRLAHIGSWTWEVATGEVTWSDELHRIVGDGGAGTPSVDYWLSFVHPEDRARVECLLGERSADPGPFSYDCRIVCGDGSVRWVEARCDVFADRTESVARMAGTVQDVTERTLAREALRLSESLYGAIVDTALECVITMGGDGAVREFNSAAQHTFGYSREEAVGRELADLIVPPAQRERHRVGLARLREGGDARILGRRLELSAMRADGSEFPVELSIVRLSEDPLLFAGFLRDITERRSAERHDRARRDLAVALAESATTEDAIERALPVLAEGTGFDRAGYWPTVGEAIVKPCCEVERSPSGRRATPSSARSSPLVSRAAASGEPQAGEAEVCCPIVSGSEVFGVLQLLRHEGTGDDDERALSLLRGFAQQLAHFIERREAEQRLHWQVAQQATAAELGERALRGGDLGELMDAVVEAVMETLDVEFTQVLERSPVREALVCRAARGWRRDMIGREIPISPDAHSAIALRGERPVVARDLREEACYVDPLLREHGITSGIAVQIRGPEGAFGVLAAHSIEPRSFTPDDARFVQAVANVLGAAIARAHGERLQMRLSQAQRLESVGQLAGGIAHDFNNLLAVILNYAGFARDATPDADLRRDIEEIEKAGKRAAELTHQLLVFSRRDVVAPELIDVNELVVDTEKLLGRTLGEQIDVRVALTPDLPRVKHGPGQLQNALINLAVNARDAMPGGGRLDITTGTTLVATRQALGGEEILPGTYVTLTVADTGCGMPSEVAAQAFDPFFTTKPAGKGTGLGLATVYGAVRSVGGFVDLNTELNRGTCVTVGLPAAVSADATEGGAATSERVTGNGETVLVVEDEDSVRTLSERILTRGGYRVVGASDAQEALAASSRHRVDLLLTDVVMPGVSGRELSERVAALQPGVRILYMSGYTGDVLSDHGVLDEGTNLIHKPFAADALLRRVRDLLGSSH